MLHETDNGMGIEKSSKRKIQPDVSVSSELQIAWTSTAWTNPQFP
jgi:hypothetical protein